MSLSEEPFQKVLSNGTIAYCNQKTSSSLLLQMWSSDVKS